MEDNWTNSTDGELDINVPAHLALHYLMFFLFCVPALLLTLGSTAALLLAKGINIVIRLVLQLLNMLLMNAEFTVSMALWIISFPI